jgi:hypothetical protein
MCQAKITTIIIITARYRWDPGMGQGLSVPGAGEFAPMWGKSPDHARAGGILIGGRRPPIKAFVRG